MTMAYDPGFEARIARVETLTGVLERCPDPATRSASRELVGTLLDLHRAGMARILELVAGSGDAGGSIIQALARDGLVASLLLLHGLHPVDLKSRVGSALDSVRKRLGPDVGLEMVDLEAETLRLRLTGGCGGCPSSAAAMKKSVEDAVLDVAPDLVAIEFVEATATPLGLYSETVP
jgi:Fe-S cluster biogenesis protein NfuA